YRHLRSGHWFHQLAAHFLHAHALHRRAGGEMTLVPDEERAARSDAVIRRACVGASVLGACAAGTSTAATVLTAETNGWAAPLTVPVAALAVAGDMIGRALLIVAMSAELGDLFGVHFEASHASDLGTLYAAGFGLWQRENGDGRPQDAQLVERIARTQ